MLCSSWEGQGDQRGTAPGRGATGQSWSLSPLTSTMSTPAWSPAERSKFPVRRRYWNLGEREDRAGSAGDRQGHSQEGDRNHRRGERAFSGRPRCCSSS